ncbi:MAG: energy-coupling factor ABC transporter permease [Spirochaetia bacterium]|nr:energy-coupling factor ABC transporter permease [Spirochaetia bacterium]
MNRYILFMATCLFLFSDNLFAMHISEGILPYNWAAFWFAAALPFIAFGLYRLKKISRQDMSIKPLVGLLAAMVFIISCLPVPVPVAGSCSHPCGTGLSGILIGPVLSILVSAAALLIQALFLAHGGLSTWGANVFSMGVAGSFCGYLTFKFLRGINISVAAAGFFAGLFADWATYFTTSVELASGIGQKGEFLSLLQKIVIAFIPTQLPLGIVEGAITAGMILLLQKRRPDLLAKLHVIKPLAGII